MYPNYQVLPSKKSASNNYTFFQSHKLPVEKVANENLKRLFKRGMGFGGITNDNCRIWIDEDMAERSYVGCRDMDETYENGSLLGGWDCQEKTYLKIKH